MKAPDKIYVMPEHWELRTAYCGGVSTSDHWPDHVSFTRSVLTHAMIEAAVKAEYAYLSERFGLAAMEDCENGVRSLNETAAQRYLKDAPHTMALISEIHAKGDVE